MSQDLHAIIEAKLLLSRDELLIELGESAITKYAIWPDLRSKGLEIYTNLTKGLLDVICLNEAVRKANTISNQNNAPVIISALIDCVSGYIFGISPVTFCVLVFKDGLHYLCKSYWSNENDKEK